LNMDIVVKLNVVESLLLGTISIIVFRVGGVSVIFRGTPTEKFICEPNDVRCFKERIKEVSSLSCGEVVDLSAKLGSVEERFNKDKIRKELMGVFPRVGAGLERHKDI